MPDKPPSLQAILEYLNNKNSSKNLLNKDEENELEQICKQLLSQGSSQLMD
jgi:hypothetical protein